MATTEEMEAKPLEEAMRHLFNYSCHRLHWWIKCSCSGYRAEATILHIIDFLDACSELRITLSNCISDISEFFIYSTLDIQGKIGRHLICLLLVHHYPLEKNRSCRGSFNGV